MRHRGVLEIGVELFDDRVPAVLFLHLDQLDGRVGDERVVAPRREQLRLVGVNVASVTRRTTSRVTIRSLVRRELNAVKVVSAISASEIHCPDASS